MAEKGPSDNSQHEELEKNSRQDDGDGSSDFSFNMKQCSDALKETFSKNYEKRVSEEGNSNEEEEKCNDEVPGDVEDSYAPEYDEEHLKELHKDMTDEQLQALKEDANGLKNKGNELYKSGNFSEAIDLYTQALNTCPLKYTTERSVLYGNRAAASISMDNKKNAVEDCNKALELNPSYMKVLIRRAQLLRKLDNLEQSLEDYKKILELDPRNGEAHQACMTLPSEIQERNEKLKTEMLGKLKDLGNMVLRPFGLSTENFKMVQDPNTGGYSVNFQSNAK